ncbi:MAG: hypothetical protein GXO74_14485 [Calditrichaeota bacterium]|nr:hypothetical protein [Calditrichota bacterium]
MKRNFSFLIVLLLAQFSFAAAKNNVSDSLVGTWQGRCKIYLPISKIPKLANAKDTVNVKITIHKDGSVQGKVGDTEMMNCRFGKNRGWFGRWLNIKTDFIIKGGYLKGSLYKGDSVQVKTFTLPFNIIDGKMRGSVMRTFKWKYPFPLVKILLSLSENSK